MTSLEAIATAAAIGTTALDVASTYAAFRADKPGDNLVVKEWAWYGLFGRYWAGPRIGMTVLVLVLMLTGARYLADPWLVIGWSGIVAAVSIKNFANARRLRGAQ